MDPITIYTVGHSTRSSEEFLQLLQAHGVLQLVDVRTVPRSRRNPQFNQDTLPATLAEAGITYAHLPELGGLRKARPDSINDAWENASFRGYADYMQTPEFAAGLERLLALARGHAVEDILSPTRRSPHKMTRFAQVEGERVTYPKA